VEITLALAHQGGAVVLFGLALYLLHTLMRGR
jgi:heme A synthase